MIEEEIQNFCAGFIVEPVDPVTDCVVTPFQDKKGDPIRIFIRQKGSQYHLFNEKGKIFDPENFGRFAPQEDKDDLRAILRRFDLYHIDDEISADTTAENLPQRFRNMVQAFILLDVRFR